MNNLPIGSTLTLPDDDNVYTKTAVSRPAGSTDTPSLTNVEIWVDQLGNEFTPNLAGSGFNPVA